MGSQNKARLLARLIMLSAWAGIPLIGLAAIFSLQLSFELVVAPFLPIMLAGGGELALRLYTWVRRRPQIEPEELFQRPDAFEQVVRRLLLGVPAIAAFAVFIYSLRAMNTGTD